MTIDPETMSPASFARLDEGSPKTLWTRSRGFFAVIGVLATFFALFIAIFALIDNVFVDHTCDPPDAGAETGVVPRVIDTPLRRAQARLCDQGFRDTALNLQGQDGPTEVQGDRWTVAEQRPRPGTEISLDTAIQLAVIRDEPPDSTSPSTQDTTEPEQQSPDDTEPDYDEVAYLATVRAAIPELVDTDEGLIESAQTICDSFEVGESMNDVLLSWQSIGQEIGLSNDRAIEFSGTLVGAATATYCPEYS